MMAHESASDRGKKYGEHVDHYAARDKPKHWIAGAIKHPGALHRELHVPEGKRIPASKLAKAEHSKNPTERRRANLAKTLEGMRK